MRTSFLSRTVIAAASLAIGSAALVSAPADAATATGITRDMVLAAATGLRADAANEEGWSFATNRALNRLIGRACTVEFEGENHLDGIAASPFTAGEVDGLLISADVHEFNDAGDDSRRECTFAVLTTTNTAFALSGRGSLSVTAQPYAEDSNPLPPVTSVIPTTLSGDVFVTGPMNVPDTSYVAASTFTATGNATRPFTVTTTTKVAAPKSKAAKKVAKTTYTKKLKAAKKAYTKDLKKAGNSKSKKAAAKKAYAKRKATAKAAYKKVTAPFRIVRKTTQQAENRAFTVSANLAPDNAS